ncbi:hypothetical protein ALC56_02361 [Trachymyrmex septentrionalis]|uniref:Uncharacterized protein n=1 Tax=Trachymyrmex septentrionalis TaxID=34720 RepID=A0A195FTG3_9HYME|nr:hypothetical protein ALC56_02361 [Trachymyrmex septentrionalis]
MHRGGGSAGGAAGGGIVGGAGGSHRALELEHPSAMPGAPGFHWGAMFAGHHAAAAAGMMQPPMSTGGEYVPTAAHHGPAHPAMPMDLHVHQGFPYFPTTLHLTPIRVDMNKKKELVKSWFCSSDEPQTVYGFQLALDLMQFATLRTLRSFKRGLHHRRIKSRKYIHRATRNCSSDTSRINWYSNTGSSLRNYETIRTYLKANNMNSTRALT